jgi:hypothetical protein
MNGSFISVLQPVIDPSLPLLSSSEIRRMMEDLEEANIEKDNLMQKCHNLEKQVNLLQDEKSNVITEYEILQKEVSNLYSCKVIWSGITQNKGCINKVDIFPSCIILD